MYNHTQIGRLMIAVLFLVVILFGTILMAGEFDNILIGIMVIVIVVLSSYLTLNVKIDETYLRIKFGYGIFHKKFELAQISSVEMVKNHWYYGWGMRFWIPRKMWIYNVSGLDAVEIIMKNGRGYRIGTDDQKNLVEAINNKI